MRAYLVNRTPEPAEFGFSLSPLWTIPYALAEEHLARLNSINAKWFPRHHRCQFEIEEVKPNRFALVCPEHPKPKWSWIPWSGFRRYQGRHILKDL